MTLFLIYPLAALFEIAGCFAFWAVLKSGRSPLWLAPGIVSLVFFAVLLAMVPVGSAGRAFAIYGGVYIAASLAWMFVVEGLRPDRFDLIGAAVSIAGAAIILLGPRGA